MANLTKAQRSELLASYLSRGFRATAPLAESFGVKPKYLSMLARRAGHLRNYKDKGPRGPRFTNDIRWNWAIARGEVRA